MSFSPHIWCKTCVENFRDCRNGKKWMSICHSNSLEERKDDITDCYFCLINLKGINCKNKHHIQNCDVPSAIRPIPHYPDRNIVYSSDSENWEMFFVAGYDVYKPEEDEQPVPSKQVELNDLTRDWNISKNFTQLLGSLLKEKHLLAPGTMFKTVREKWDWIDRINVLEWRHFIDSACKTLEALLQ